MSDVKDDKALEDILKPGGEPAPGHDAWFRAEVEKTLERDKAGKLTYRSIDDVAKDFGFDAS